jgi:adenylate cyclase
MDINNSFEAELSKEILKSDKFRGKLLSGIIVVMLVGIVVNSYYLKVFESNLIKPFSWLVLILFLLLIRSFLVRKFQVVWFKKSRQRYLFFLYVNTFFETSIPSVVIIIFASSFNPATALISPIVFFYFLFIILSIFDLEFKLSIFAGCIASAEYLLLSLFYYDQQTFGGDLSILNMIPFYTAKSLFLLIAGVVSGFVSLKIRENIYSSFHTIQERNNLEKVFGQQISKEIVDEFLNNQMKIENRTRDVSIMFLDIRNFSKYCEGKPPAEINHYQNQILGFMIDTVNKHGGIVNQILGDGFMATFGAPIQHDNHALSAINVASEIKQTLITKINSKEIPETKIGIGIHSGEVVTGNVGTEERKQYSIIGNTVILAARLEQLTKEINSDIILSKTVVDNSESNEYRFKALGEFSVKGFSKPVEVFELL